MDSLEAFFAVCDARSLTFDTLDEARQAASLLLKGRPATKGIVIVAEDADAPDEAMTELQGPIGTGLVIRARDVVGGNWFLITAANPLNSNTIELSPQK